MSPKPKVENPDGGPEVEYVDPGPFGGNSVRLAVTREINVSQLQDEITQRTKTEVQVVLLVDDPDHIASKANPATLYVSPGNLSERVLQAVVEQHVAHKVAPAPTVGVDPATTGGFNVATLPAEAQALVEKLKDGKDLKASESSDLLRALLGI